nr:HAMP domain-containing sensor histidine kinase [cf. Phormidesmis sp. LEGE 11477]
MIRQRDDFVARLTHDLRTPLVAANRMLSLCLEDAFGTPPDSVKEALSSIITNNENLLQMTNTLLQVYRHEAGHKKLSKSAFSAYTLVNEVVRELKPLADDKGIDLSIEALSTDGKAQVESTSTSYWIEGDRIELRRLLTNLLGNAIKFTDSGCVTAQISVNSSKVGSSKVGSSKVDSSKIEQVPLAEVVEIAIKDTGPGIELEAQKRIFEWFYQGSHMKSGSGLGLHLSKRIAEMHEGTLTLESKVGKGSTFTLMLPVAGRF